MRIQLIAKQEKDVTGISRYTNNLYQGFQSAGLEVQLTFPYRAIFPGLLLNGLKNARLDVDSFFASYPLRTHLNGADVYHLTGQMLATLLIFQRFPKPVVVTVQDIIPYLVQHLPELNTFRHPADSFFYRLALMGLRRATDLVAISEYTRHTLIDALKLPAERIHVVYPAVDLKKFRPMVVPEAFYLKYGIQKSDPYILYVGSEDPRKNLSTLIRGFALVKQHRPDIKLLKIGSAFYHQERHKLIALISSLNLARDVVFMNYVPDEDLPYFYNAAEAVIMPSFYEGFGLPAVEAMACGTPVVCARAGSLPEVTGQAGVLVNPLDVNELAQAILALLESPDEKSRRKQAGQQRAARFSVQHTVCAMRELYEKTISSPR